MWAPFDDHLHRMMLDNAGRDSDGDSIEAESESESSDEDEDEEMPDYDDQDGQGREIMIDDWENASLSSHSSLDSETWTEISLEDLELRDDAFDVVCDFIDEEDVEIVGSRYVFMDSEEAEESDPELDDILQETYGWETSALYDIIEPEEDGGQDRYEPDSDLEHLSDENMSSTSDDSDDDFPAGRHYTRLLRRNRELPEQLDRRIVGERTKFRSAHRGARLAQEEAGEAVSETESETESEGSEDEDEDKEADGEGDEEEDGDDEMADDDIYG